MDLQNDRVSNPPLSQTADPSTSTSDTSYSQQSMPQSVPSFNDYSIYGGLANNTVSPFTPTIAHPSQSKSGLFTWPTDSSSSLPASANQIGGTPNLGSATHSRAVLRNSVVGYPALAPAPAPQKSALVEASTPSVMQVATGAATSALTNIIPQSNGTSSNHTVANFQTQPAPLPTPGLSIAPSITPKRQTPKSSPGKTSVKNRKRRNKRKRAQDSDDEIKAHDSSSDDESEDMLPSARQTKSGRQVNRPTFFAPSPEPIPISRQKSLPSGTATTGIPAKRRRKVYRKNGKEINITCRHCQRGHSPVTNMIVFCDECNDAYHQYCHDPPIKQELIDDKDAEWFCRECRPGTGPRILLRLKLPPQQLNSPITESAVSSVPLVCGERFTAEEQRGYLSSLSHATLVDMLVTLSKTNPTLPVFPENLRDLQSSKFAVTAATATNVAGELTEAVTVEMKDVASSSVGGEDSDTDSDSGSEYEVEEHRLYPRPGNGFHLPPEEDDFDILLDDPACPTFSYALHSYSPLNTLADTTPTVQVGG
ncbi:PHD finger domain protein, putative [Talaromyces stipitatus ATCC 10500]|uniref:PHD finger domain protein, putative n=1 Tax=Talaromyces stipitatus (strain ATCC 10500 / CBS 375.48 / QM 6759 / NRRL 1006) TaxID=441959 RepID=B8M6N8_TALSN|nr:PHD finger domain protein, putative [Talaromyces stipitatus ATCC 10500]EED19500.1 PHD finger domain protein, putative [Talaromyces stipitatus ATCC 10500]